MNNKSEKLYIILSGIFIASLVSCNLIFQKFFQVDIWVPFYGTYTFQQSVGLLPYPITFIVTDIISEIYGKKKANEVVTSGLIASLFMLLIVTVADNIPSAPFGIGSEIFSKVFGLSAAAVFASMLAYLFAQYIDVRVYHFWKKLTHGKHLWLRNNASTIFSQFIDTFVVLALLFYFNVISAPESLTQKQFFMQLLMNGFLFKVFFAAFDTPIIYGLTHIIRKRFGLEFGEEISSS
tara:strand:+ start:287 stop:994 length:708 start_codon:yes stop_codon:yes gene_type:complete